MHATADGRGAYYLTAYVKTPRWGVSGALMHAPADGREDTAAEERCSVQTGALLDTTLAKGWST